MAVKLLPATLRRPALQTVWAILLASAGIAHAQLGDMMKSSPLGGSTGQGAARALGNPGGLSMSSLTSG